jgi:WD40 repeat protein
MFSTWLYGILRMGSVGINKKFGRPLAAGLVGLALLATVLRFSARDEAEECVVLRDQTEGKSTPKVASTGWVQTLAFSPDGTLLASGWGKPGSPGRCQLWDVAQRHIRAVLHTTSAIYAAAFAPDGRTLALGSWDGSITLWEVGTGREPRVLRLAMGRALELAFSPDGTVLVAGTHDAVVLWDLPSGRERATLPGSYPLTFSADGRTLATGKPDAVGARLWDWRTGQAQGDLQEAPADSGPTRVGCSWALAFAPDGKTLVSADTDFRLRLWDLQRQRLGAVLPEYADQLVALAFSPDRRMLATGGLERTIVLRDASTSRSVATLQGHTAAIHCIAFAPDGRTLASGSFDEEVRLWNLAALRADGTTSPQR